MPYSNLTASSAIVLTLSTINRYDAGCNHKAEIEGETKKGDHEKVEGSILVDCLPYELREAKEYPRNIMISIK